LIIDQDIETAADRQDSWTADYEATKHLRLSANRAWDPFMA
jgi:hypothetical protein